ncbi:SRPBCC family protein [Gemmatimonas phototrophica]|uniref:SRPBCC family protein n=1 Tax=Gemmatimonas phototrophica TaxID=1379270 RepID=UPI0031B5B2E7
MPHVKITIEVTVAAPIDAVWNAWITPDRITQWNAASEEWCCPTAVNDLRVGGTFSYRMEARDGSMGFDFEGQYTRIVERELLEYTLGDERVVRVEFAPGSGGVTVRQTFDAENEHAAEQQRQGWQAILNRFASHV